MNNSKRIYRAAIYVRLSKEDGDLDDVRKAESNSISNQKSLILNYLKVRMTAIQGQLLIVRRLNL